MPSTRAIRRRITATKSTRQITKALELVSAAKMRRASQSTLAGRPYAQRTQQAIADIAGSLGGELSHPLFRQPEKGGKTLVIAISSTRGLAGGYDANVIKQCVRLHQENSHTEFLTVGRKGAIGLSVRKMNVVQSYPDMPEKPVSKDILPIAQSVMASFLSGEYQEVKLVYTHFYSLLRQEAEVLPLLPLTPPQGEKLPHREFVCEPSSQAVLDQILPRMAEALVFQSVLEAAASEHSARRMAMKNATDNAGDLINDLTLTYNGLRQGAITQELAEISGGVAALTS